MGRHSLDSGRSTVWIDCLRLATMLTDKVQVIHGEEIFLGSLRGHSLIVNDIVPPR